MSVYYNLKQAFQQSDASPLNLLEGSCRLIFHLNKCYWIDGLPFSAFFVIVLHGCHYLVVLELLILIIRYISLQFTA